MTRRSRIWLVVAALFSVVNLAGGVVAAAQAEPIHASVHAALALLGAFLVWRLLPSRPAPQRQAPDSELTDRLTRLEQAVDAVAIEVERIGEGQRFITRRFAESSAPQAAGERAAEPLEVRPRDAAPRARP